MLDRDKVRILSKALKQSASNHHYIRLHSDTPELHYGYHWQHCPASSCTLAFIAMVEAKVFTQKDIDIRQKKQEEYKAKIEGRVNDSSNS